MIQHAHGLLASHWWLLYVYLILSMAHAFSHVCHKYCKIWYLRDEGVSRSCNSSDITELYLFVPSNLKDRPKYLICYFKSCPVFPAMLSIPCLHDLCNMVYIHYPKKLHASN